MTIGFLNNESNIKLQDRNEDELMLQADSGRGITFGDATHHLIILGTTGSGKTHSVYLPTLNKLIEARKCGLIVDIKGNVGSQVRSLAQKHGRGNDILEIGSSAMAHHLNLLEGMAEHQKRELMRIILTRSYNGNSHNEDFHIRSVDLAVSCIYLLEELNKTDPHFIPSISRIAEMFTDFEASARIWKYFRDCISDPNNKEHRRFISSIKNNHHHFFNLPVDDPKALRLDSTFLQQMAYITNQMQTALRAFLETPGISSNFSSPRGHGLRFREWLNNGKIILLRFDPGCGPVGATLARYIISAFYETIYGMGMQLAKEKQLFIAIDEFQEAADFSNAKYSDTNFSAMAREFNTIFLASTQSIAAMVAKGASLSSVEGFLGNMNNCVIFHSDEPHTNAFAQRNYPELILNQLKPGEALFGTYNSDTREHSYGIDTFQKIYSATKEMTVSKILINQNVIIENQGSSIIDLGEWALNKWKEKSAALNPRQAPFKNTQHPRPSEKVKQAENGEHLMVKINEIVEKYPEFFIDKEFLQIAIPVGWQSFVNKVFHTFSKLNIPIKIYYLGFSDDRLIAKEEAGKMRTSSGSLRILNSLLSGTKNICIICGARIEKKHDLDAGISLVSNDEHVPICNACCKEFNIDEEDTPPFVENS